MRAKHKVRTGRGLVSTQIRWPVDWLDRIDELSEGDERAPFVRDVLYLVLSGRYAIVRNADGAVVGLKRQTPAERVEISDPPARGRPRIQEDD